MSRNPVSTTSGLLSLYAEIDFQNYFQPPMPMPLKRGSTLHSHGKETFMNPNAQDTTQINKMCDSENDN